MSNKKQEKRFILLASFSNEEIFKIINCYKLCGELSKVIFASLTDAVKSWTVEKWLEELIEENNYFHKK